MKKRVLSAFMALALCLTLLPAAAWAKETDTPEGGAIVEEQEEAPPAVSEQAAENGIAVQATGDAVAEVTAADGTSLGQFASLNNAITAAQEADSATVKLLADVTTTAQIVVDSGTFTLDLNGKKWDKSGGYMLNVTGGSVTVTSSEGTGTISNTGGGTAINVAANAAVHVTNGVRLSRLFAAKDANLTLDVGVIITETLYANTDNIAPFLTGKALQACDENDKPIDGKYVSIYEKYDTNAKETGCVIVIKHKSCAGTPSEQNPCTICGYDGTQDKPTEPEDDPDVAEIKSTDTKYKTLAAAIAAANGAEITLLRVFGENVVVSDESIKASIILGTGDTIEDGGKECTYPSYWIAASRGIPLTMDAGEITLKEGVLAQFGTGADNNIAIKLNGGTLTVAGSVTKIIGGSVDSTAQNTAQMAAIKATGGVLDLQGNTHLDGGLSISGDAVVKDGLKCGIFTNSGSSTASVSVKGNTSSDPQVSDSKEYGTVFDLLAEGYAFAKYNADGTTGDVIQKANDTKSLTDDVTVIKCKHKGANGTSLFKDGECAGCGFVCEHKNVDAETGQCSACGTQMAAKVSGSFYSTLAAAIEAAKDNGTVTVLADVEEDITIADGTDVTIDLNGKTWKGFTWHAAVPLTVSGGSVTLQNGKLEQGGASSYANTAIVIKGGSLTVGEGMTIQGGSFDADRQFPAIEVKGGELTLSKGTQLGFGMKVSVEGKVLADYLPEDTAFTVNGSTVNGYVTEYISAETLVVAEHTHSFSTDGKCACGFTCAHSINQVSQFENGVCKACGYVCPHTKVYEHTDQPKAICTFCGAQMAVKVKTGNATTYYAKHFENNAYHTEDTLKQVFNEAASDSTVTLLADGLYASGWVTNKSITLNLNGKKLVENNGLVVDEEEDGTAQGTLTVTGEGSSETPADSGYPCTFRVWGGGTLLFDDDFSGTYGTIYVHGGTLTSANEDQSAINIKTLDISNSGAKISFKAGNFGKICFSGTSGSVKLGDLLGLQDNGVRSGCAFQKADGTFLRYDTVIDKDNPVENVKIAACLHDSVTSGTCDYCGMENLVAAVIDGGGAIGTYAADSNSEDDIKESASYALAGWDDGVGNNRTLKLYVDFTSVDRTLNAVKSLSTSALLKTQRTIDLNGHTITGGTLAVNDLVTLTIKDSTANKGSFSANVTVNAGASLTVDGVSVGKITAADKTANITLKAGSSFTGYALPDGMTLADWLPAGCCVMDSDNNTVIDALTTSGTGNFVVKKIPAAITAENKTGSISYGGAVPENLRPTVTMDEGAEAPQLTYEWRYKTTDGFRTLPSTTPNADDKLDVVCVITAKDSSGKTLWATSVTGYELTVSAANLADATVTATNADSLIFTPDSNGVGQTQTLEFTVTYPDQYTMLTPGTDYEIVDSSNTAANAGEHTLTLQGMGNYAGSTLEYKWTVKPRELTGMTDLSKPYDGTADLPDDISFTYGENGTVTLEKGTDFTVTGGYDSADAGERTVTATVTLTNPNYTFAGGETQKTFTVDTQITKAAVSGLKNVSQTIRCAAGVEQSVMPELTSFGIPADAQVQDIWKVDCSNGALVTSYGSKAPGVVYCTLGEGAKVGDTFSISFTIVLTNYQNADVTIDVTLIDRDTPTVSANDITVIYDGSAVPTEKITGTAMFDGKTVAGTWSWAENQSITNVSDSGEKTVIFTPTDKVNYKPVKTTVQLTINPAKLTNVSVQQTGTLTYTGKAQYVTAAASATAVNDQPVTFTYSDSKDGTYTDKLPVTNAGTFTMYFKAGAPNHEDYFGTLTVKINKADPICAAPIGVTATYGQTLSEITLTNPSDNTPGEWTWTDGTQSVGNVGKNTFTAKFTPGDQLNYNSKDNIAVTVTVQKAESTVSAEPTAKTLTYNGSAQELVSAGTTADGTMLYSLSQTGEYTENIPVSTNAGEYTVWYKVKGDGNHNDSAPASVSATIAKAQVTVTVKNKSAYVGSTAPDLSKPEQDKDYTVSGLIGEDKLPAAPTLKYVDETGKEIKPDMTKVGEVLIRADGEQSDNYVIVYVAGKLTVTTRPSGGGSSGGTTAKTETTTNPDGSTTKTETKSDGTVTETTTYKDGSTTKTETKPDGSSKTEVRDASGSTGTVNTDKNGQITAEAKVSDKAVSDAKKADEAVKIPAEVTPGKDSKSAPTVKIDLPSNSGETKIEIPVKDVTSGTVAVIVKPDGTEEIVKDSIPTEDGIQLTVNGDVTVKIVDNAKNFTDTKGHWAQDSIDFVSARGLVNGTSSTTFSSNAPTTRAQLWTILARQAGADLTGGANWYEKAQNWAKANGISDGTNPNGTITRAQMVTMLWRAAGSPEVSGTSRFTDVPADSYYAKAVAWAVEHGITTGVGNGKFDPNGICTRAQIATFLHRSYLSK